MRCALLLGGLDKPYMERLMLFLLKKSGYSFDITFFETIEEYYICEELPKFNLAVLDRPYFDAVKDQISEEGVPVLVLEEAMCESVNEAFVLFKYRSAPELSAAIHDCFLRTTDSVSVVNQGKVTQVTGCFAPMGGAGTTTVSHIIARARRGTGERVLHISLDTFTDYDRLYSSDQAYNLSDYSAWLMTRDNWMTGLAQMVAEDKVTGIHYIKSPLHMKDMLDFQEDYLLKWLQHVKEFSDYDRVILDFGSLPMMLAIAVMASCEHKVIISRMDAGGWIKCQRFFEDMKALEVDFADDMTLIGNMAEGSAVDSGHIDLILPRIRDLQTNDKGDWLLNRSSVVYRKLEVWAVEW